MSLPDDVLDHILSFLQSDFRALKACSQSHPKFIPFVERHLYATVTLYDNNTISQNGLGTRQFISLLSDNPHIANYIRSLEVEVTYDLIESVQYLEDITSVLRMCSLLNKITLKQIPLGWAALPEAFRLAFLDCLHLSTMKAVCIIRVFGFPLKALEYAKNLKRLTLCGWIPDGNFIPEPSTYPLLEDLSIQDCGGVTLGNVTIWPQWVQARNRSLEFLAPFDTIREVGQLQSLLSSCSNILNLNLDFGTGFRGYYEFQMGCIDVSPARAIPLSLSSLVCLERLTISADLEFHFQSGYRGLPDVYGFSSSISAISQLLRTASSLQHLTLDFHFYINARLELPYDPEALWSPLVTLVSESSSPCINLRVKATKLSQLTTISPEIVTSSFASCPALTQMIEQGVLVIIPVMPDPPMPKEPSYQDDTPNVTLPAGSSNINDCGKEKSSRKWLPNFWPFGKSGRRRGKCDEPSA